MAKPHQPFSNWARTQPAVHRSVSFQSLVTSSMPELNRYGEPALRVLQHTSRCTPRAPLSPASLPLRRVIYSPRQPTMTPCAFGASYLKPVYRSEERRVG